MLFRLISLALDIMGQIIASGKVTRGWLGVEGEEITARAAMATGNPGIQGAMIVGVFPESPAAKAGIRPGDIIVAGDAAAVTSIRDLLEQIVVYKPGDRIKITIYRGPQKMTLDLQVAQRPEL